MKQIITTILSLLILLQPFSKVWVYVTFSINQATIAKTLCVQKAIPNNSCQGICLLKQQLRKTEEQRNQAAKVMKEKIEVLFFQQVTFFSFELPSILFYSKPIFIGYLTIAYCHNFLVDVFHPPQTCVK